MTDWMERKHIECWKASKDNKHSKALMEGPQQGRATKLLNMSRQQLSIVIGLLTGHLGLYGHLYRININDRLDGKETHRVLEV